MAARNREQGQNKLGEIGEVIDIIKKHGDIKASNSADELKQAYAANFLP